MVIAEFQFREDLEKRMDTFIEGRAINLPWKGVTGPGRSGAVASVYVSYLVGLPYLPWGVQLPKSMAPVLVVDTVRDTGKTLKKACSSLVKKGINCETFVVYDKPAQHLSFWYEG